MYFLLTTKLNKYISTTKSYDPSMGNYVQIEFTAKGQEAFASATSRTVGSQLYICLDGVPQSAPTVKEVINSSTCVIEGDFTGEEAALLANVIREGQLPFSLVLIDMSEITK